MGVGLGQISSGLNPCIKYSECYESRECKKQKKIHFSLPAECSECIESSECSVWFEEFFWLIPSECCNQTLAKNNAPNIPYVMNLENVTNKRKRIFFSGPFECSECTECSIFFFPSHLLFNVA